MPPGAGCVSPRNPGRWGEPADHCWLRLPRRARFPGQRAAPLSHPAHGAEAGQSGAVVPRSGNPAQAGCSRVRTTPRVLNIRASSARNAEATSERRFPFGIFFESEVYGQWPDCPRLPVGDPPRQVSAGRASDAPASGCSVAEKRVDIAGFVAAWFLAAGGCRLLLAPDPRSSALARRLQSMPASAIMPSLPHHPYCLDGFLREV